MQERGSKMIDDSVSFKLEEFLTPDQIASLIPSRIRGRRVSPATVRRWQQVGLRNGKVFLSSRTIGSVRCSTRADLERFFDELTVVDDADRHIAFEKPGLSPAKARRADDTRHDLYEKLAHERNL